MTASIDFTVRGLPVPQGALVRSPSGGLYHRGTGALGDWRHAIADECRSAMGSTPTLDSPVRVVVAFHLPRPKGHRRTNGELKTAAPTSPTGRPDVDKLVRAVLDAITAVAIADDSQVVWLTASKHYADACPVGATIRISEALP